jgi:hypothetical protein
VTRVRRRLGWEGREKGEERKEGRKKWGCLGRKGGVGWVGTE